MKDRTNVKHIDEYKTKKVNKYNNEKKAKKKKLKRKILKKIVKASSILVVLGLIIAILCGYSIVSELKYELNALNKELDKKLEKKDNIRVELDVLSKSGYIEEEAKTRLNMDSPKGDQIEYIDVE
jgi:cell division protein FtsL